MMNAFRHSIVGGIALTAACHPVQPPTPKPTPIQMPPVEAPLSVVSMPIKISASQTKRIADSLMRKAMEPNAVRTHEMWNPKDSRDYVDWAITPENDFGVSFGSDSLRLDGGLAYDIEWKDVISGLPDPFVVCPSNHQGPWPRMRIHGAASMRITNKWEIDVQPQLSLSRYSDEARDGCTIHVPIHISVVGKVSDVMAKAASKAVVKAVSPTALPIRPVAEQIWSLSMAPIHVTDGAWLVLNPTEIGLSLPFSANGSAITTIKDTLVFTALLKAKPLLKIGDQPAADPVQPLPDLANAAPSNAFAITLDAILPIATMTNAFNIAVTGLKIPVGGKEIEITSGEVLSIQSDTVYMRVGYQHRVWRLFTSSGWMYVKGHPSYNALSGETRLDNLEFDLQTKDIIDRVAAWMAGPAIQKTLQAKAVWNVAGQVTSAKLLAERAMNAALTPAVRMQGTVGGLVPIGIWMTPGGAVVRVMATGTSSLTVDVARLLHPQPVGER